MNGSFGIEINYGNKFLNEAISDVLRNMDALEAVTEQLFNHFSSEVTNRKERIVNVNNRVIRIRSILQMLETLPQSLSFKSMRNYPHNRLNGRAFCDHNTLSFQGLPMREEKLNKNPCNDDISLGQSQPISFEEAIEANELNTQCIWKEEMKNKLSVINNIANKEINPFLSKMTSAFQLNNAHCNLVENDNKNGNEHCNGLITPLSDANSLLNEGVSGKQAGKKKPFEAPVSLRVKEKMKQFSKKQNILSLSKREIDLNLPSSINLGNITDVYTEDYQEEVGEQFQSNTINDDSENAQENDDEEMNDVSQLPINLITSDNANKKNKAIELSNQTSHKQNNDHKGFQSQAQAQTEGTQLALIENLQQNQKPPLIELNSNASIPLPPPMPDIFKMVPPITSSVPQEEKRAMTMQEEIGDNPIAHLKTIGSIQTKNKVAKDNKKDTNINLMDVLKEQIQLRFKNLHKHQQEDEESLNQNSDSSNECN